jgi:hypothetical protein
VVARLVQLDVRLLQHGGHFVLHERRQLGLRFDAADMLTRDAAAIGTGFAAFAAAHAVETLLWERWFGARYAPWFLNSGRAVAFTSAVLFAAGAFATATTDRAPIRGLEVAAGAALAMLLVFFAGDTGTLVPIVLAVGGAFVVAASVAGGLAVALPRRR